MSEETAAKYTLFEHINDLRKRLFRALLALFIGVFICAIFAQQLLEWLAVPIGGLQALEAIEVTENITVFMQATLLGGVALGMPVIVYQLWQFIAPGLYRRERRYIYLAAPAASILFLVGGAFCYYVMLPAAVPMLLNFVNIPIRPRPANYMSFTINLMFWTGVSFETPLLIFFLAKVHLVDYRFLLRNWRIAIFLTAVLAAIITPTVDPINMALVMGPLIVLYFMSIVLARIAYNPKKVEEEED